VSLCYRIEASLVLPDCPRYIYSACVLFLSVGTTKEHLGFALALQVPIVVTVSKTDTCSGSQVNAVISQVEKLLKSPGCKKVPFRIDTEDDAITAASHFHNERWVI